MYIAKIKLFLLVFLVLSLPIAVLAHPVAQGALTIEVEEKRIEVHAQVSLEEVMVARTYGASEDMEPATPDILKRNHAQYFLKHFSIVDEQNVALTGEVIELSETQEVATNKNVLNLDFQFVAPKGSKLRAGETIISISQNVLNEFDFTPGNRWEASYLVKIGASRSSLEEGILLTSKAPLIHKLTQVQPGKNTLNKTRLLLEYLEHGIQHILSGYDHLLFISALVLATVTLWDLIKIISAFTLAHTITLTLAILNIFTMPSSIVEPIIAASIVFVALQNLIFPKHSHGCGRLVITFAFGLFHGLGFAGGLLTAMQDMSSLAVGLAIVAFSFGVELGQQLIILPLFLFLKGLRSYQAKSKQSDLASLIVVRTGSALVSLAGCYYFIYAIQSTSN